MVNLTQENFNDFIKTQKKLVETLNHRVTKIEKNVSKMQINQKWMNRIGYYMAGIITTMAIKLICFQ